MKFGNYGIGIGIGIGIGRGWRRQGGPGEVCRLGRRHLSVEAHLPLREQTTASGATINTSTGVGEGAAAATAVKGWRRHLIERAF